MLAKLLAANADREFISSLADIVSVVLVVATIWINFAFGYHISLNHLALPHLGSIARRLLVGYRRNLKILELLGQLRRGSNLGSELVVVVLAHILIRGIMGHGETLARVLL
jgi:hypothetical protein